MSPRTRLLRDGIVLAVVVVAALAFVHGQHPSREAAPAVDIASLPPRATCDSAPVDRGELRIDSALAVECPGQVDRRDVLYVGEVVGDVIRRSTGSWVQLNDDAYALSLGPLPVTGEQGGTNSGLAVWLPSPLDRDLVAGRSRQRGTVLAVTGTFHRADPRDGGGTTIRAEDVRVLDPGAPLDVDVDAVPAAAAIALLVLAGLQWRRIQLERDPRRRP